MSKWINKILYVAIALTGAACIFLYIGKQSLEKDIVKKDNTIANLTVEVDSYKTRLHNSQVLNVELNDAVSRLRKAHEEIISHENHALKEVDEISRGKNNAEGKDKNIESSVGNTLPPELNRVLSDLCERVRGSTCPSP